MAITAEQLAKCQREWAANYARQLAITNKQRFDAGEFTIDLVKAEDEPGEGDPAFQDELSRFGDGLRATGIPYSQTAIAMDSVDAHGFPLPEFIVAMKVLGPPAVTAIAGYATAWIQARNGRKVRLRIGDVEAEARTVAEITELLGRAASFQDRVKGEGNMQDAELRGELLSVFYELRHNAEGWVPTSDINVRGAAASRQAIGVVCQQLADAGLIHWKALTGGDEGFVIGMAKITGLGVDVVTGSRSPSIDVRFPQAEQPDSSAIDLLTKDAVDSSEPTYSPEAAEAVYEAIEGLVASGKRAYAHSVPLEAENILVRKGGGRLRRGDANDKIKVAIVELANSGKIDVSPQPRKDWSILEPLVTENLKMAAMSRKIFIVHGHDGESKERVARFLSHIGFDPIILHEQPNRNRTIIEKIEANGDVDFAVVLLTPDDEGCAKGGVPEPRARQNVLLELGYFMGRLGRDKVCALRRGSPEIPSDFAGVVWEAMDDAGAWKQALGRELGAAGFEVDWNKVMG